MARKRSTKQDSGEQRSVLRHVLVVGGTTAEWEALDAHSWSARRNELAKAVAHGGAAWLTIRPFGPSPGHGPSELQRIVDVREGCTVIVDPSPSGRQRFLAAVDALREVGLDAVDEAAIAGVLMAPAPVEPDLTIILGSQQHLPPSLVWELAYSEIVNIDVAWNDLTAAHVEHAIDEFSKRHRRFGGIDVDR